MLDRVDRLPREPCLLARGTQLYNCRQGSFLPCRRFVLGILANQGEINRENMAAQDEFCCSYHWPVLSADQNDSQSEEINVIDESRVENRPMLMQEAEIRWQKVSLVGCYVCHAKWLLKR